MLSRIRGLGRVSACVLIGWALGGYRAAALQPGTPLARFSQQTWSVENGLPQNTISVLMQSRKGFLFAGTDAGLARFDGVGFRVYDHASSSTFPDAEIRCVLSDGGDGREEIIWVGTADGLVRLDGNQSVRLTTREGLPSDSIRGLVQSSAGTVWIWTEGGLARWDGDHAQIMTLPKELSDGTISSIAADTLGGIWVGTAHGAAVFRNGVWREGPGGTESVNTGRMGLVAGLTGGDVLIATGGGVFAARGADVVEALPRSEEPTSDISFLTRMTDGTMAMATKSELVLTQGLGSVAHVVGRLGVGKQLPGARIETMFADREGSLWIGTNRGLARISMSRGVASAEALPATDPLSTSAVGAFLEDREGSLWVGTETAGLHILRDARFRNLGTSDGFSSDNLTAIVEDSHKSLWIGSRDAGLNHLAGGKVETLTTAKGLLSNVILSLAAGPDGTLWVGTPDGLNRIAGGSTTAFTSADGLPDDFIRSLLVAADNSLWIGTRRGFTHFDHGQFHTWTQADGLGSDLVGALARTSDGDLWVGTLNGLTRLHEGRLRNYTTADGLSSNVITALESTPDGTLWIGTQSDGLNFWDGERFTVVSTKGAGGVALMPNAIHAVAQDERGHLWLATDSGLSRLEMKVLLGCVRGTACSLDAAQVSNYTTADGLRGRETSSNSHPTACLASDGELWFTSPRGAIVVDPPHFPADPGPPPVAIERFAIDDRDEPSGGSGQGEIHIKAGHLRFEFNYAGLSFAAPQKVRYQYMLEGFDHAWTNAGTRRTAYYTNIPPGSYRFRVRAAMDASGISQSGARLTSDNAFYAGRESELTFVLEPHLYQTTWFRLVVVLGLVALVLLIMRLRVLRVEREFGVVMTERNRIAREIHDTLAQGYVGISLQLEILGQLLRHNRVDAAEKHLATTQELVREGLNDARQSIWALRSQDAAETTLPIRLRRYVEKAGTTALDASLKIHGAYRALSPEAEQEILRIAQEAISNAQRHAAASRVEVRLEYDEESVVLTVTDNGKGFEIVKGAGSRKMRKDIQTARNAGSGHYGLIGMQERAALIQGVILIDSEPGQGTRVRLTVTAARNHSGSHRPEESDLTDSTDSQAAEGAQSQKEIV